ncbi:hypothetical protein Moror_9786 [Moniliophthora roreri MCA 2997]|uniref:Uncharacterized protein n=1 Tax=Moniliophthora roreri (strain MCA 2997) TaxID=1381753 RepID=V2WI83_MONRO|nr:hypothetical protein Moror_9786 [Moniliophthora roreri MCA 2997]
MNPTGSSPIPTEGENTPSHNQVNSTTNLVTVSLIPPSAPSISSPFQQDDAAGSVSSPRSHIPSSGMAMPHRTSSGSTMPNFSPTPNPVPHMHPNAPTGNSNPASSSGLTIRGGQFNNIQGTIFEGISEITRAGGEAQRNENSTPPPPETYTIVSRRYF